MKRHLVVTDTDKPYTVTVNADDHHISKGREPVLTLFIWEKGKTISTIVATFKKWSYFIVEENS